MKVLQTLLLLTLIVCSCKPTDKPPTLPSFGLELINREGTFNTSQIDKDHPVILVYLSPDCQYCQEQMNTFLSHIDDFKKVNICIVSDFSTAKLNAFDKKYNLSKYSNIIVGRDTAKFFVKNFRPTGTPYTAIYDKQRFLKYIFPGAGSYEDFNKALSKL